MGILYFGKQWLTKGGSCCTSGGNPPVPARGFRLVSTGGGGGGLLTFGKSVGRGSDWSCPCGLISAPFTFTVHFNPDGIVPNAGNCCLLYENSYQDETLIIRYELRYCSETDDFGFFKFTITDLNGDTNIRTNSGYHLLGGSLQVTCTNTAPHPNAGTDRRSYMAIYINGLRADTSTINNDGDTYNFADWPKPGNGPTVYNNCMYDPEEPDNMQLGIVYEWNRGFTPNEAQDLFNTSINKQPNPSLWGAFFQEPPPPGPPPFGYHGNFHQRHDTGQTNDSISHDTPINQWTTTKGIGMRRKWILGAAIASYNPIPVPLPPFCGITEENNELLHVNGRLRRFQSVTFNTGGSYSWTAPANIYSVYVECIGGGGGGGIGNSGEDEDGGGGGGGGAYAASLLSVIPGTSYSIDVGVGGAGSGSDGNVSGFNITQVLADYGLYGGSGPGGFGGLAANCVGQVVVSGSNGFTAQQASFPPVNGASGGAAAGGGLGGSGSASPTSAGFPGQAPGGGGGGGGSTLGPGGGAAAADGLVRISWITYDFGLAGNTHQTHTTGQTNWSIPHCNPLNDWTTTKGISIRNKYIAAGLPPNPTPPPPFIPCATDVDVFFNTNQLFNTATFANVENSVWVAPYGVYEILIQIQSCGQDGYAGGDDFGGNGGPGGACAFYTYPVVPGQSYTIVVNNTGTDFDDGGLVVGCFCSSVLCDPGFGGFGYGGDGGNAACAGSGGGAGGNDYGVPGGNGALGGGGGGGGPGAPGGLGSPGWVRIYYASLFGLKTGNNNHYVTATHQTHQTGQTNNSIPHCVPLNQWTTTQGISVRNKRFVGSVLALSPNEFETLPCARVVTPVTFIPTDGDVNTTWTVPYGVCQILVECQGDGGEGQNGDTGSDGVGGSGGNGGHGGGYGSSIINVVPGTIYNINITEGSGAFFQTQFFVNIVAGYSGDDNIAGGLGDLVYDGLPGGGGSPGGPQIEDNNGIGGNGGVGGTSGYNSGGGGGGGGAGLNGSPPATGGSAGANYGGGGGGGGGGSGAGETPGFGGLGGMGFVRISWHSFYGLKSPRICPPEEED